MVIVNELLQRAIDDMGFREMTPIQEQAIPPLLLGKDIIGQAQTGTGKTAAFGLPILEKVNPDSKKLQFLILTPTRELAMQVTNELRSLAKYMMGVRVMAIYGGQDIVRQIKGLRGVQIVVGTPGRVMDHMRRHTIKLKDIEMVVLDEADEMLNMGFREDMEYILSQIEKDHQTCLFSATMPKPILDITSQYLKNPIFIKVTQDVLTIESIEQYYYGIRQEYKYEALKRILSHYNYRRSIVFCNMKTMVARLAKELQEDGFIADGLHGDLNQKQRDFVMNNFRNGNIEVLICTDIAARGIDVDDVEAVINYDIPQEVEYYVHRIGRTGRAGKDGIAHTFVTNKEFNKIHAIEQVCHVKLIEKEIPSLEQIKKEQERRIFEDVLKIAKEEKVYKYLTPIYNFCKQNNMSIDEFACALFRYEVKQILMEEDIDLSINKKPK
ncbi:MAG: DEAD/DEAH box helicase [Holdemanella sp.]|nr:DEAD/DEAH box helicase [Holdemanella sp.]